MPEPIVTTLSARGQVTIPAAVRAAMGIEPGARFLVSAERDTIVLRVIRSPAMSDMNDIVGKIRKAAKQAGVTPRAVKDGIRAVRSRR